MCYKKAINWDILLINIKSYNLHTLNRESKPKSTGQWIKYYRRLNNWSQRELAYKLGLYGNTSRNIVKDYEIGKIYPSKEISKKLAIIFKLNSSYFFDEYHELTNDNFINLLSQYRNKHKLTKTAFAKLLGTSYSIITRWEKGYPISRKNFCKLKELGII